MISTAKKVLISKQLRFKYSSSVASGGWTRFAKHDGAIDRFELSCNEPSSCADLEEQKKVDCKSWK